MAKITDYTGEIRRDTSRLNGMPRKLLRCIQGNSFRVVVSHRVGGRHL
ncbi:hypothetical protein K0G12_20735 [Parabacteroides distasonis]|nr:hypothetical protein [Parabacteroides distasonis]MCE9042496.1 hypothetical protein [Parabacteroides distasonis]